MGAIVVAVMTALAALFWYLNQRTSPQERKLELRREYESIEAEFVKAQEASEKLPAGSDDWNAIDAERMRLGRKLNAIRWRINACGD